MKCEVFFLKTAPIRNSMISFPFFWIDKKVIPLKNRKGSKKGSPTRIQLVSNGLYEKSGENKKLTRLEHQFLVNCTRLLTKSESGFTHNLAQE